MNDTRFAMPGGNRLCALMGPSLPVSQRKVDLSQPCRGMCHPGHISRLHSTLSIFTLNKNTPIQGSPICRVPQGPSSVLVINPLHPFISVTQGVLRAGGINLLKCSVACAVKRHENGTDSSSAFGNEMRLIN